ncbi:MAG TPA: PAS domain S-box protein [Flavitalea sp.]|nr:PAS domain S-box protein [Flavitalea sp.]
MKERNLRQTKEFSQIGELLRKSEERYHKMIEEVEDYAIILLDENGTILDWNKGAEKIKGYPQSEIIGKHFSVFYLPEDRESGLPEKLLNEAKTNGKAVNEGWRIRKDGSKFWGSISLTSLHDEQHEIIGYSKVTRDLTERKMSEDTLKHVVEELQLKNESLASSEERYHKMVEEVEEYAIIFLDPDGIIQNWNKGAQKIKQYKESEAVGRHFRMFYLPEDRLGKLPEILLAQAVTHGRAIHEGWRMRKDGSRFWGSITLTALHNENGGLIGFSKVTRDLTEKKMADDRLTNFAAELQRSNEELRKSEERYHKMIAEVQDYAIILMDVNGNIQNWNMGAQNIKGYSAAEIIGKNFQIFYGQEDRQTKLPQKLLSEAEKNGRAIHEGWRVRKNGSKFWGSIVITALHNDEGNVIGYSKVTRDLTEKKITEDKLKDYVQELKHRNEELDRFAFATSHDLQEPLRKVQTFADLIAQHPEDTAAVKRYIHKIIASSERMLSLIRSVLEYSRLSKKAVPNIATDLNEILAGVIADYEIFIHEKQAKVKSDPLPVIKAIPTQITQLFSNLMGNALKFSTAVPVINISAGKVFSDQIKHWPHDLAAGEYYEVVFSDNGIGFQPQYAEQIFALFQRLHGKHEYSGSGIGLSLCKKIMDNHHGFIHAEGHPGEGATFFMYFPVNDINNIVY